MSNTDQTLSVVRNVFEAFQEHDVERFRAMLSDKAVLRDPSTEEVYRGPDAITATIKIVLDAFPDLRPEVTNLFASGEQAAAEVVRRGTHTGELKMPNGSIPPTGQEVCLPESIIFQVREGKVLSMTTYVDRLHVMEELGLAPSQSEEAA